MAKKFIVPNHFAWIDLEMTGLDTGINRVVEIACMVTDNQLNPIGSGLQIVVHQPEDVLQASESYSMDLHTRTGLYDQVRASKISEREAEAMIVRYLRDHGVEPGTSPLCGNTIGSDRRFIMAQWPELQKLLHYRDIDVSSIKVPLGIWRDDLFQARPVKAEGHRALDDILESIEELRYYKSVLFDKK